MSDAKIIEIFIWKYSKLENLYYLCNINDETLKGYRYEKC